MTEDQKRAIAEGRAQYSGGRWRTYDPPTPPRLVPLICESLEPYPMKKESNP